MIRGHYPGRIPSRPLGIPKPSLAYICPVCDVLLADGVAYSRCPACDTIVDWVDVSKPLWACPGCDYLHNRTEPLDTRTCPQCETRLRRIPTALTRPGAADAVSGESVGSVVFGRAALLGLYMVAVAPLLALSLDATFKFMILGIVGPILLLPLVMSAALLGAAGASWRELRDIMQNRKTRVVHGLEHAAIKLLEAHHPQIEIVMGQTWDRSFEVCLQRDVPKLGVKLRGATRSAIRRIGAGETELAYDPRCGTSYLVAGLVTAATGMAAGGMGLLLHLDFVTLLLILLTFVALLAFGTRPLGLLAQRLVTVSTDFEYANIGWVRRAKNRGNFVCYVVDVNVVVAAKAAQKRKAGRK